MRGKLWHKQRKEKGLCTRCENKATPGFTMCAACREKNANKQRMKKGRGTPITPEEIKEFREKLKIGQLIEFGEGEEDSRYCRRHKSKVIEKHRHFAVCEYTSGGNRLLESVLYVQLIMGDGTWLA